MSAALLAVALRQAASPGRLGLILLLGLLPLVVAAVLRATGNDDDLIEAVLDPLVIALFLPIAVLTVATTAFGNEVEDRTLGLLTTKPAPRAYIVLVKLGATLAITAPMVVVLAVIVTAMGDAGDPARAALAAAIGAALGVLAYASIFIWAGLITGRALGFGLAYVLIWEALMTSLIDGARFLSVRSYTKSIMQGLDDGTFDVFAQTPIGLPVALIGVAIVSVLFTFLTIRRLSNMDVP